MRRWKESCKDTVLTVAKKTSDIMAEETGVEAPMKVDDMKGLHGSSYERASE